MTLACHHALLQAHAGARPPRAAAHHRADVPCERIGGDVGASVGGGGDARRCGARAGLHVKGPLASVSPGDGVRGCRAQGLLLW